MFRTLIGKPPDVGMSRPRFAFIARNLFQARRMAALCRAASGVMVCRPKLASELQDLGVNVETWRWPWRFLDGQYPVLAMHGSYSGAMAHRKSKIAMIQYGYSKEPYNFGAWRAAADLILAYGPYAAEKFGVFAPVREVGYPQAALVKTQWRAPEKFKTGTRLRVLYAPTWGDLSSLDTVSAEVIALQKHHEVTVKLHHNTIAREPERMAAFADHQHLLADPDQSLDAAILANDVIISDNSGAIFDAIFCQRPVVLANGDPELLAQARKSDPYSLEIAQRNAIGIQAPKGGLRDAVATAAHPDYAPEIGRDMLFSDVADPIAEMVVALEDLLNGHIHGTQMQTYTAGTLRKAARRNQNLSLLCIGLAILSVIALLL